MDEPQTRHRRYRFEPFTVSPATRLLCRDDRQVPLIPRYFDLLLLLIERRHEAVQRRVILDAVWSDVVVSDGALSQAIRVLRRALGDDPRRARYIQTVSRHGYRFVFPDVTEEEDRPGRVSEERAIEAGDRVGEAIDTLLDEGRDEAERREAAEFLHTNGTAAVLSRIDGRPGQARARALLRDSRWEVAGAGPVPLLGRPGGLASARILVAMRVGRALRQAGRRWVAGIAGGALSGLVAGTLGGLVLRLGPGSTATGSVVPALALIGLVLGGVGALGVGAGMACAETSFRSRRGAAIVLFGALGGGAIGALAHALGRLILEELFGRDLSPLAGGFEGLVLGGAAALGYALATPRSEGGMATPRGWKRPWVACAAGLTCSVAAMLLASRGSHLGAMSLDFMARTFPGSDVGLGPVARLLGESAPAVLTSVVISGWEGLMFGFGLVLGLTHRPR